MNSFDDLASLDLGPLVEVLASHAHTQLELTPHQWLGTVELLTMRLTDSFGDVPTGLWGTCSLALANTLEASAAAGVISHHESVIRRLNLSLTLLRQVPPNANVDILDPSRLIDLLLQELPMSAEEARDLATGWRALDISQIRRLRAVKNLVSPGLEICRLVPDEEFDPRLKAWEGVFPLLP